jgi:hypothetical protein
MAPSIYFGYSHCNTSNATLKATVAREIFTDLAPDHHGYMSTFNGALVCVAVAATLVLVFNLILFRSV